MKSTFKNKPNSDFLPLFEGKSICQANTSDAIPDSLQVTTQYTNNLFNLNHPVGLVLVLAHSEWAFMCSRSILLQQFHLEGNPMENRGISAYNKTQLAYNEKDKNQSYHWIYLESTEPCKQKWIQMIGSLSFAIIIQDSLYDSHKQSLQAIHSMAKSLSNFPPQVFQLCKDDEIANTDHTSVKIQIGNKKQIHSADPEFIQSLLQNGKNILSQGRCFGGKQSISAHFLPFLMNVWEKEVVKEDLQPSKQATKIFHKAIKEYEEHVIDECLQEYRNKMHKLQQTKKCISNKLIKSTHEIVVDHCLKKIEKSMFFKNSLQEELYQVISHEYKQIVQNATENNFQWAKQFLKEEFSSISTRIHSMQIKSLSNLKQEILIFRDFFHKKTQQFTSKKLTLYFEEFLTNKLIQCTTSVVEAEKVKLQKQIVENNKEIQNLQMQCREYKKEMSKRNNSNSTTIESLQEKLLYYSNREEVLENLIENLKKQMSQMENEHEQKISQMQKKCFEELNNYRKDYLEAKEEGSNKIREIVVLESEIEKERLLHAETKTHYDVLLKKCRERQENLEKKLQILTVQSYQEIQLAKSKSFHEENAASRSKNYEKELTKAAEQQKKVEEDFEQLEQQHKNLQYQLKIRVKEYEERINDLEVSLKLSEQKTMQLQSRMPRFLKCEQDYQNLQIMVQEMTINRKNQEKENALLAQEKKFMKEKIHNIEIKLELQKNQNEQLKNYIEQQSSSSVKNAVKTDEWVQTDFQSLIDSRVEECLMLTQIIERQYRELKKQIIVDKLKQK